MVVRTWRMRIQIPQVKMDEVRIVQGTYPWTALQRASDLALRALVKGTDLDNMWDLRLIKEVDNLEPFTITFLGRIKPTNKRERAKVDGNITLEPVKPVEDFVPLPGVIQS